MKDAGGGLEHDGDLAAFKRVSSATARTLKPGSGCVSDEAMD